MATPNVHAKRREYSFYLLFAALLLLLFVAMAAAVWYLIPVNTTRVEVGPLHQYPVSTERPYIAKSAEAWIVNINGDLQAFSNLTPYKWPLISPEDEGCPVSWNNANSRFEDPCSGSKFRLDGTLIGSPATRDLDRLELTVRKGKVYIETGRVELGACRILPSDIGYSLYVWNDPGDPPLCVSAETE